MNGLNISYSKTRRNLHRCIEEHRYQVNAWKLGLEQLRPQGHGVVELQKADGDMPREAIDRR